MMFWIFIYWLLCAFIVIGTDDGEPWTVGDKWYIVFAGFYVPIVIGLFIGSYIKETGFFDKNIHGNINLYVVRSLVD